MNYISFGKRFGLTSTVCCLAVLLLSTGVPKQPSADEALTLLKKGNTRYATRHLKHPDQSVGRMHQVETGQHPFAVVLGCADSRVPPEIIFDQGLGDLFVIRVAGAAPDDEILGSIEYAVEHLHTTLVVVMGHEKCGAVTAALGEAENNHTRSFVNELKPAVEQARSLPGDLVHNAMCLSVDRIVAQLRISEPVLKPAIDQHHVRVIGAHYDLHSGKVVWHPK